ncbi:MAG: permease [Rikenellaceae bacterium]
MEYLKELFNILNAMSPYLLLGFFVAGVLHVYIPKSTFSRYLSKKGFKSVFLSALFGVPLPLCSCGVIPTAMSLKKEGASNGATVSFLIATPQTGIDSILASYGVLGLPFAIIRPIAALIVALFGGLLVDRFSDNTSDNKQPKSTSCHTSSQTKRLTFIDALKYGFVDMLQDLGKWLTIGLIIAAAITLFVPPSLFETFNNYYILNILIVLLLSIPMYICSTGSIPIALSLMMVGISPGAALLFLMAGPATNVATLAVVKKVLGGKTTALYLLSITLGAIGFAALIDFALPAEWFTAKLSPINACGDHCSNGAAWWQTTSTALFIILLLNAYIQKIRKGDNHTHDEIISQTFNVKGMRCNHCKANIEKAINALPDVISATADLSKGTVEVQGTAPKEEICSVVRQLGFEIE